MKKIYKYILSVTELQTIFLPKGSEILSVQEQHDSACLWALVPIDDKLMDDAFTIAIFGTGHAIYRDTDEMIYLGTFQLDAGNFVGHAFLIPN